MNTAEKNCDRKQPVKKLSLEECTGAQWHSAKATRCRALTSGVAVSQLFEHRPFCSVGGTSRSACRRISASSDSNCDC